VDVTATAQKSVGSTEGMNRTRDSSPYYRAWVDTAESDLAEARRAVLDRDFDKLADIAEYSCLKMHALALAARPGLLYWNGATVEAMHAVRALRAAGVPVFFTVDAGPQVKAVCLPAAAAKVREALQSITGVLRIHETGLGEGARIVEDTAG
jgi:diphosphomevalonate decarboxylase